MRIHRRPAAASGAGVGAQAGFMTAIRVQARPLTHRLLSAEEERELALDIECGLMAAHRLARGACSAPAADELAELRRRGETARELLIRHNLRLVGTIAGEVARRHDQPVTDLFQEGVLGLIEAIERYDLRRGVRLGRFAAVLIRARVRDWCAERGRRGARTDYLADVIVEPPDPGAVEAFDAALGRQLRRELLACVGKTERAVLALRVGLAGPCLTRAEAGRRLGLPPARVRSIERSALATLRRAFAEPAGRLGQC